MNVMGWSGLSLVAIVALWLTVLHQSFAVQAPMEQVTGNSVAFNFSVYKKALHSNIPKSLPLPPPPPHHPGADNDEQH